MSTTTKPTDYIPAESDIKPGNGNRAWHFAYGKIARGKRNPIDNSYPETRSKIVGRIQRVGVFNGVDNAGKAYRQLELDIKTVNGLEHVKCGLLDNDGNLRPSVSTLGLTYGLSQCEQNELIEITAILGSKPITLPNGQSGGYPTYVNVGKIDANNQSNPIYRPKLEAGAAKLNSAQQWDVLLPQLKAKAYYKERAPKASAYNSHIEALNEDMKAKNWPTIPENPEGWMKAMLQVGMSRTDAHSVIDRALGTVTGALSEHAEHAVGQLRLGLKNRTEMPAALRPLQSAKPAPVAAPAAPQGLNLDSLDSEYDPFADE